MYTLVKSCITNEDSTYTRKIMHYERGLHMYTLVKSCITNEDSTYTREHSSTCINSSGHA